MKKAVLLYVYFLIGVGVIFPQNDKESSLTTFFGFSIIPYTLWRSHFDDYHAANFVYDFDPGIFYILEFGLKHKSGIEMAVSLDVDNNNIEKLSNIVGRLGFKRITTRVSFGDLNGTANWKGAPVPYQPPSVDLDTKYFQLDLLYNAYNTGMSTYFGLCYTSYDLPVIIDIFSIGDGNTAGIYDTVSFRGYGISVYGDTLNAAAKNKKEGLGIWINLGTALTFGSFEISDKTLEISKKYREEIDEKHSNTANKYTGENINNSGGFMAGNYELTVGLYYIKNMKRSLFGLSAGYNIWGRMIMMGVKEGESRIQYLYRHGFIMKAVYTY